MPEDKSIADRLHDLLENLLSNKPIVLPAKKGSKASNR
jgi:hypothetical protein